MDDLTQLQPRSILWDWPNACWLFSSLVIALASVACSSSTDEGSSTDERSSTDVVSVEFVAFGDIDGDGGSPLGVLPDVRIVILEDQSYFVDGKRDVVEWWDTVGGSDSGISSYIPPGVQVSSSADAIESVPASYLVTGPEGTAKTTLTAGALETPETRLTLGDLYDNQGLYLVCAISPINSDLISGCGSIHITLDPETDNTVFIHFSHGRSYIEMGQDGRERYQRFLDGTLTSQKTSGTATVTFAVGYSNEMFAIIDDADIGTWWEMISNNGEYTLNIDPDAYGYGISFDPEMFDITPASIATTSDNGTVTVDLEPGEYLFCYITTTKVLDCDYKTIADSRHHVFAVYRLGSGNIRMTELSEGDGKQLLQDIQNWEAR